MTPATPVISASITVPLALRLPAAPRPTAHSDESACQSRRTHIEQAEWRERCPRQLKSLTVRTTYLTASEHGKRSQRLTRARAREVHVSSRVRRERAQLRIDRASDVHCPLGREGRLGARRV